MRLVLVPQTAFRFITNDIFDYSLHYYIPASTDIESLEKKSSQKEL